MEFSKFDLNKELDLCTDLIDSMIQMERKTFSSNPGCNAALAQRFYINCQWLKKSNIFVFNLQTLKMGARPTICLTALLNRQHTCLQIEWLKILCIRWICHPLVWVTLNVISGKGSCNFFSFQVQLLRWFTTCQNISPWIPLTIAEANGAVPEYLRIGATETTAQWRMVCTWIHLNPHRVKPVPL